MNIKYLGQQHPGLRNLHRVGGLGAFRPSMRSSDQGLGWHPARPYEVNVPILTRPCLVPILAMLK